MSLEGRVALITGAGSGIGKSSAQKLAAEGASVGCLSRTESQLHKVVDEIERAGGRAIALTADVREPAQMQAAIQRLADEWGRIDIVVANAGVNGVWTSLEDLTVDEWDTTLDINLKGTFLTLKYTLPWLKQQGGSVIVVASVLGTRIFSFPGVTAYGCSKAAQVAFAKMTALELAPHRVRVNCICPGWIETEIGENTHPRGLEDVGYPVEYPAGIVPLTDGKPGSSQQVAELVYFLASDDSDHISGTELWIDGAQSLIQG
jgi:NAD(P)-dependent dehydrogenase (short-subunit alcohol dehydrogenase family)